ncbi:hypothetical protein [Tsukamurella soli]
MYSGVRLVPQAADAVATISVGDAGWWLVSVRGEAHQQPCPTLEDALYDARQLGHEAGFDGIVTVRPADEATVDVLAAHRDRLLAVAAEITAWISG